jgi:hypothetical protein
MNAQLINTRSISNLFDIKAMRELEQEIEQQTEASVLDDSERYNVFMAVERNGDFKFMNLMSKIKLTNKDEELLKDWLKEPEHTYYMNDNFKVILDKYIMVIKIYKYEKTNENMVLYGFAVNNTAWDKMTLQIQKQKDINCRIGG